MKGSQINIFEKIEKRFKARPGPGPARAGSRAVPGLRAGPRPAPGSKGWQGGDKGFNHFRQYVNKSLGEDKKEMLNGNIIRMDIVKIETDRNKLKRNWEMKKQIWGNMEQTY